MSRGARRLLGLAVGVVALLAAWQAFEEWRVRRRLDEALAQLAPFVDGPVETWLARLPPPVPRNASMRQLERLAHGCLVDLTDEHVRGAALDAAYGTGWRRELGAYVKRELDRSVIDGPGAGAAPPAWLHGRTGVACLHLVTAAPPAWPRRSAFESIRRQVMTARLTEMIFADALMRRNDGFPDFASLSTEAGWRLVDVLRRRDDDASQLLALSEAARGAGVMRYMERPDDGWPARLRIDPFRQALLHASIVECFEWHARALERAPLSAVAPASPRGGLFAKLPWRPRMARSERLAVAEAIEATVPLLRALDDPARCGPATIPQAPARGPGRGVAALGGATTLLDPMALERLDRVRVHFELTRRILELRERRAADPVRRWPADPGEEEGECPGVRFRTTVPQPQVVAVEAISPAGDPWLERAFQWPSLSVELVQPPP